LKIKTLRAFCGKNYFFGKKVLTIGEDMFRNHLTEHDGPFV
tara:strand:- start:15424 stop:15546 length:123 start_codon:yes stop_codon:yes gene_type:complete